MDQAASSIISPPASKAIQAQLAEILEWAKNGAQAGAGFVQEQAPLVAKEIVAWGFWYSVAQIVFSLLIIGICAVLGYKVGRWFFRVAKDWDDKGRDEAVLPWIAGVITLGVAIMFSIFSFNDIASHDAPNAVKAAVAPRLYVIDYITEKLK